MVAKNYLLFPFIACLCLCTTGFSQKPDSPSFGVHFGYALINITSNIFQEDTQSGFFVGASLDFDLTDELVLGPKVLYASYSDVGFLHVPVFLNYRFTEQVYATAGPQMTFVLEDPFNVNRELGLDLGLGLGYNFSDKVYLEGRYAFALTNRIKDADFDTDAFTGDPDVKYSNFLIGFGYRF